MKSETAKRNPLILKQAMFFYLDHARQYRRALIEAKQGEAQEKTQEKAPPLFCFMSLWDDEEPYPLSEVIQVLSEHIAELENANQDDNPSKEMYEVRRITLNNFKSNLTELKTYAKRITRGD